MFAIRPATWAERYPLASGTRQSPVDVDTSQTVSDTSLDSSPLTWKFVPENNEYIVNTGYGWKVEVNGEGSELVGGPLEEPHVLEQYHCHWGSTSDEGSEHTVDGQAFAGELHLVHWNNTKYETFGEAAGQPDGLAVLGILFKVGEANPELEKIVQLVPQIIHRDDKATITEPIDIEKMMPEDRSYWTYLGSLTTPPCNESVTWILFKEPIEVSEEQLAAFRSLRCYCEGEDCPADELQGLVINNYRPPLPLGNRVLRECGSA
ncbi:carbonic anhydrase 1 isoform X2 [Anabrus simplex]|uniref:carbonic anhydrase 1 isoform X2 n=1 Tax=Anabrus simplex TaxID=316456 RepID=UPI0035A2DC26